MSLQNYLTTVRQKITKIGRLMVICRNGDLPGLKLLVKIFQDSPSMHDLHYEAPMQPVYKTISNSIEGNFTYMYHVNYFEGGKIA